MSTYLLCGFRRRHVLTQHRKDEVGYIIDAADPRTAVEIARKILGPSAALFDGAEIESAPDEVKRRLLPLAKLELCIAHMSDRAAAVYFEYSNAEFLLSATLKGK